MRDYLTVLVKPASSSCNMRCSYCFYHEHEPLGIMSAGTVHNLIDQSLVFTGKAVTFAFQGGEPALCGLRWFENFVNYVRVRNVHPSKKIFYALQTNGLLIDEQFAVFLRKNDFLVGLSLDGYKDINDYYRTDNSGDGTYNRIKKTADLLVSHKVEFNILTVINNLTAKHIEKIYNFYKKSDFRYLQFTPCLDPLYEIPFGNRYSLTPELYRNFLIKLFDLWYTDIKSNNIISVRFFDNILTILNGGTPEMCGMGGFCAGQFVVESDGGVYPCDFYCLDEYKAGNINSHTFEYIANSSNYRRFTESSRTVHNKCTACSVYGLCRGGCRRSHDGSGLNVYCSVLFEFYNHVINKIYNKDR